MRIARRRRHRPQRRPSGGAVIRRTWRLLRPHRARAWCHRACSSSSRPAATLAGPAIVRYGIDDGRRRP